MTTKKREFTESYVSITCEGGLYAWWQVDHPETVRVQVGYGHNTQLVLKRQDLIDLAKTLKDPTS